MEVGAWARTRLPPVAKVKLKENSNSTQTRSHLPARPRHCPSA